MYSANAKNLYNEVFGMAIKKIASEYPKDEESEKDTGSDKPKKDDKSKKAEVPGEGEEESK